MEQNQNINSKQLNKILKDIEILSKEVEFLRISDMKKTLEIQELKNELNSIKSKSFLEDENLFSLSQTAIFNNCEPSMDVTWIDAEKDVLSNNLKNLVSILVEICNTPYEKNKSINMIPLLKADKKELKILEEYIFQNMIKVKFILFDTRTQLSYNQKSENEREITKKPKNYVFNNATGVKFDGTKFEKILIKQ